MALDGQHLLYMFDFVVDDLVITRVNRCAPTEYSTCVEISFRSNVFLNICDREYGDCMQRGEPRCGKCNIFPLDGPITKDDKLWIHVYKKRTTRCKFLIGMTSMEIKPLFDEVNKKFQENNFDYLESLEKIMSDMPDFKEGTNSVLDTCDCFRAGFNRREQLCPSFVNAKKMLSLFNLCKEQTGNIVLVMRLLCHGPTIVSQACKRGSKYVPVPRPPHKHPCYFEPTEKDDDHAPPTKGHRYFACNLDKLCPCDVCEDEFDRECPTVPSAGPKCAVEFQKFCGDCRGVVMMPKFISCPKRRKQKSKRKQKVNCV